MLLKIVCAIAAAILIFTERTRASDVVDLAAGLIGRPYVWGAEGPNTFDCSGLTQYVFREFAVDLPRRAISQSRVGDSIGKQMQRMIEASKRAGRVRRSDLDDPYWVERLMFARRIMADPARPELARERPRSPHDTLVDSPLLLARLQCAAEFVRQ